MKRILITGGSSYLGQHLVPAAMGLANVCYTYYRNDPIGSPLGFQLDIRDSSAIDNLVREFQPDVIIHLAGSNRGCDIEEVIRVGAQNIVATARRYKARIIHMSTDSLLDGASAPYTEADPPSPITAYGRAKAEAERTVSGYMEHVIIRTSLIYGLSIMDHSTRWIQGALDLGQPVTLYSNQIRQPIWTNTLSQACLELAENAFRGVINVAGNQALSRADYGQKLLDWWQIDRRETLIIGPADKQWPMDCRLDLTLATNLLSTPLLGVDDVLALRANQGISPG